MVRREHVQIQNLHRRYKINKTLLEKIAFGILKITKNSDISEAEIVFLNDAAIMRLNKRYKQEDRTTDVLSFGIESASRGRRRVLAEIFISLDEACRNSRYFKTRFEEEIVLYVIHGILHLCGYDDLQTRDRARMAKKQSEILKAICTIEDLSTVLTRR